MLKKIILIGAACLAVSTAASAKGWYVGADAGYVGAKVAYNQTAGALAIQGARGGLFTGYGVCLGDGWYLAPEFKASMSNLDVEGSAYNYKLKHSLSTAARLGYYVYDNTMIYANVGASWAKFQEGMGSLIPNAEKWKTGVQYGLGTEVNLTGQLGVRMEWLQTQYAKSKVNPLTVETKPTTSEANIGLVWTIGGADII